jgi:ecotin
VIWRSAGWGRLAALLALLSGLGAPAAAPAIPRLDLKPYPAPAADQRRWVIQLPGVLKPSSDPAISANPADWRVELIVGRELEVDCNRQLLRGRIEAETIPGWGYRIFRVSGGDAVASTRMACPPDQPPRRQFVALGGEPTVVRYNASLPIVVYAPRDLQVRWRLWKAETGQQKAQQL